MLVDMVDTCAIWGVTNYTNSWLSINIMVIVASLLAIAVAYSISSFLPASSRGKMRGFVRFEMIQLIISIVVLAALLAFSTTACGVSANISQSLSHKSMDPFQYADYYIGSVSLGHGLTLLSNIYSASISYSVYAAVMRTLPSSAFRMIGFQKGGWAARLLQKTTGIPFVSSLCASKTFCKYETSPSMDFAQLYNMFAALYLDVYSPIVLIAVGVLFIQFLMLPIMQYTAFTIILPVSIGMRSISFFGASLGDASNALIAIAVAFYIIYPMTVAFDSYAIAYVFSPSNPAAQYVGTAFTVNTLTPNSYFQTQNSVNSTLGVLGSSLNVLYSSFSVMSYKFYIPAFGLIPNVHTYTNNMAQFVFEAVLLFALNVSITMGLAMSLYKALKSGLGEAGRFW